jgi:hypothetical protein
LVDQSSSLFWREEKRADKEYRQTLLEELFPAYHAAPTPAAVSAAEKRDDAALDSAAAQGALVEPRLNFGNTAIKFVLDQTVGAAVNTYGFSMMMHALKDSMAAAPGAARSIEYLASGTALDYSKVNWDAIRIKARRDFWPLLGAGWRFWPIVSLSNFALVQTVEMRNLVGALAGLVWGVYMSLFTASK